MKKLTKNASWSSLIETVIVYGTFGARVTFFVSEDSTLNVHQSLEHWLKVMLIIWFAPAANKYGKKKKR